MTRTALEIQQLLKEQEAAVAILLRELHHLRSLDQTRTTELLTVPQPTLIPNLSPPPPRATLKPILKGAIPPVKSNLNVPISSTTDKAPTLIPTSQSVPPIPSSPKLIAATSQYTKSQRSENNNRNNSTAMDVDIEPGLGTESNLFAKPSVPVTTTSMNFAAASSSSNVFTSSSSIDQDSVMGETEFGSDAGLQSENGDKERPSTSTDEKRRFKKTCLMVWSKLAEHRYGNVFTRAEKSPFYLNVIKNPINLAVIKNKIRDGEIATIEEFHHDILLMLANAVMFNDEGSEIAEMAKTLRIFVERELAALENVRRLKEFMSRD